MPHCISDEKTKYEDGKVVQSYLTNTSCHCTCSNLRSKNYLERIHILLRGSIKYSNIMEPLKKT